MGWVTTKPPRLYVPLDANYYRDIAVRKAGPMAELLYIRSLAFAKCSGTGGFVSRWDLDEVGLGLRDTKKLASVLVSVGLWDTASDGWTIRSWERWNAAEAAISAGGRRGNHIRWHVQPGRPDSACELCQVSDPSQGGNRGAIGGDSPANRGADPKRREEKITPPAPPAGGDETARPSLTVVPEPVAEPTAKPGRRKPQRPLPDDFAITADMKAWSDKQNLLAADVVKQTEYFKRNCLAADRRYADWVQAWQNWMTKDADEGRIRRQGFTGTVGPILHEWDLK